MYSGSKCYKYSKTVEIHIVGLRVMVPCGTLQAGRWAGGQIVADITDEVTA
jgi:hypothetical protein